MCVECSHELAEQFGKIESLDRCIHLNHPIIQHITTSLNNNPHNEDVINACFKCEQRKFIDINLF